MSAASIIDLGVLDTQAIRQTTSIHQPSGSMGHTARRCTSDPGSTSDYTASLPLPLPRWQCPLIADTWLVGQLMAMGPGPLNNGRLRHNHLQRGEDSLWPHHLPLPIPKPWERDGGRDRDKERERQRERERESKLQCEPRGQKETEGAIEGEDS